MEYDKLTNAILNLEKKDFKAKEILEIRKTILVEAIERKQKEIAELDKQVNECLNEVKKINYKLEELCVNQFEKIEEIVRDTSSYEECNEMLESKDIGKITESLYKEIVRIMKIKGVWYD